MSIMDPPRNISLPYTFYKHFLSACHVRLVCYQDINYTRDAERVTD